MDQKTLINQNDLPHEAVDGTARQARRISAEDEVNQYAAFQCPPGRLRN